MFKRKKLLPVKENVVLEKFERFFYYHNAYPKYNMLTPKELHALRYHFGDSKINIADSSMIEKISMNDLQQYEKHYIITSKNGFDECSPYLSDVKNLLNILTQRIILVSENHNKEIISLKIYVPSPDDTILYLDNELIESNLSLSLIPNDGIDFYVIEGQKAEEPDFSKEMFAFTKCKIGHSSIVLHYVP